MDLLYTAHVPPGDGPHPTILALHGFGASAHDLLGLAPVLHGGGALVLCPQGPLAFEIAKGMLGFGWAMPQAEGTPDPGIAEYERSADLVRGFLAAAKERYPIDPRKVVPMGFSQGGVLAYDLVLRNPQDFAGLIALSSWLPAQIDEAIPAQEGLDDFPALVIHGSDDPMIPIERGQESRERLMKRGLNVAFREYPMGHEIGPDGMREIVTWIEEKVFTLIQLA
ncbi:MAG: dienelactone hydrolase family protein [Myxococcota bacterium]|nr:dienelactone hydrolase family protein [Myxococcota bacterium]